MIQSSIGVQPNFQAQLFVRFPCKIFLSKNPFQGLQNKATNEQVFSFLKRRFTHVISLLESDSLYQAYLSRDINAEHLPISRLELPEEDKLRDLICRIAEIVKENPHAKILIHSENGTDRNLVVAACVYKFFCKSDGRKAMAVLPRAIKNRRQIEFIENYGSTKPVDTAMEEVDFDLKRGYESQ